MKMHNFSWTFLFVVLSAGISVRPAVSQTTPEQQLVARAKALDSQGRHDLAADSWHQVLLVDPKQADALAALAAYAQSVGDTAHANQYRQQLRAAGGSSPVTQSKAGAGNGDARLQQAAKLAAEHRYSDALSLYRQVFGTTPPAGPWAVAYYQTAAAVPEELPSAIAGLRSLIEKYPQEPTYKLALGEVMTYKPATRLEGVRMLQAFHGSAAQDAQARAAWRQALVWDPAGPAATQTGAAYLQRYPDEELAARLKSQEPHPAKPEPPAESPLEGEGYKALAAGDLSGAREKFSALLALPGSAGKAHAGLGYIAMQQQDFAAAIDNFEKAKAHGLQNPAVDKALGESRYFLAMSDGNKALKANDFAAAVADFTRARQIDPQRPEAIAALGGALMAQREPGKAEGLFAEAVKRNPDDLDGWVAWFDALLASGDGQRVLDEQAKVPAATNRKLEQRVDYLAILSSANKSIGDDAAAQRLIDRVQEVSARGGAQSASSQLRAAGLLMQQNNTDGATQLCRSVLQTDRNNVEAWEMLVRAAHVSGDDVAAMSVAERMPEAVYKTALKDPEFLMTLATIDQGREQYEQAAKLLERARSLGPEELADSPRFLLQQASLDLASGNPERAYSTYRKVASEYPDQLQAWSGMLAALHEGKHDAEAIQAVQKLPADVSVRLQADTAFLQVLASVYSEAGHPRQALECLRMVSSLYQQRGQAVPFAVDTQFAWLLLNQGDQRNLAATLDRLGNHRNLPAQQKLELENIWAAWSMRRAEADYSAGNGRKALSILQIANQAYPENTVVRHQLCSMYVRTGNPGPALKIYEDMNWEAAKVGDFASAVDAALVAHRVPLADKWLQDGLQRFPGNDQLLAAGARLEEQRGDIKKAKEYLTAVIDNNKTTGETNAAPSAGNGLPSLYEDGEAVPAASPEKALAEILGAASATPLKAGKANASQSPSADADAILPSHPPKTASPDRFEPLPVQPTQRSLGDGNWTPSSQNMHPATYQSSDIPAWPQKMSSPLRPASPSPQDPEYPAGQLSDASVSLMTTRIAGERPRPQTLLREASYRPESGGSGGGESASVDAEAQQLAADPTSGDPVRSFTASTPSPVSEASLASEQQASDQLARLESRYSPYSGGGGLLNSHTGTSGFDRLQSFSAEMESSSVVGDSVRFTVIGRPVLLESGIPDSSSNYRFGSSVPGTGSRAIVTATTLTQIPTTDQFAGGYGGELQIAAKFVQGSVGYSPANFPVTHVLGSIAMQPGSFPFALRAYREVVPDTLLSYAGIVDPYSGKTWGGVVATGGTLRFAQGTGLSGIYASLDGQELTGRNVKDNSRISGGAGAYFQVYGNKYGALKVGANLTAMHYGNNQRYFTFGQGGYFSPNMFVLMNAPVTWQSSPYRSVTYDLNGSLGVQTFQDAAAQSGSLIVGTGAQSVTGASYDFHARVAYHLNQHWVVGGFVDANNARDYRNVAGGFSVRYMIRPVPAEGGPTGLVDAHQLRPLAIQ
jgi:Tfp pilus assembly protein PilF